MDISDLTSNVDLDKLVEVDQERFTICNLKIDDISFVCEKDHVDIYYRANVLSGDKLERDVSISFVFYSIENKIIKMFRSNIYKDDFYKYEIMRGAIYFDSNKKLKTFCSDISSIKIYAKND